MEWSVHSAVFQGEGAAIGTPTLAQTPQLRLDQIILFPIPINCKSTKYGLQTKFSLTYVKKINFCSQSQSDREMLDLFNL